MSLLLFFSCSSKIPYDKWDYETRRWYEKGETTESEFKVLLERKECFERLRKKFKVVSSFPSDLILVKLSREELIKLSEDECVKYVEFQKPVQLK